MSPIPRSALGSLLRGLAWILFGMAGISFWIGGRAISEFAHADRSLTEFEGIALALVCAGLGAVAKSLAGRIAEPNNKAHLFPTDSRSPE